MKSPVEVSLNANGSSQWIPHDVWQSPASITLAGFVSSGASLTWAVQYTCDDIQEARDVGWSQSTTTITVTDKGPASRKGTHGLSVSDWVKLTGTGSQGATSVDGEYTVASVVSATQYTVTSGTSQTASGSARVQSARVFTHAVLTGQTGRLSSNYNSPVKASQLVVTNYVSGVASLEVLQGGLSS